MKQVIEFKFALYLLKIINNCKVEKIKLQYFNKFDYKLKSSSIHKNHKICNFFLLET